MRIAVVGGGYVGLVTGACFAELGMDVAVVESQPAKLSALLAGGIPIYEPGLDRLVAENVLSGRLTFGSDITEAVVGAEAVFIAVGTPTKPDDGRADLSYVFAAAEQIADCLTDYTVIVTKSTVPIGTGKRLIELIRARAPNLDFDIASNPEFLREGNAIEDFMQPDRVVIGTSSERARNILKELYRPLDRTETPILFTGLETAEMIKYAGNAFLAMKVTFINEIADLCEKLNANVHEVAQGMGLDRRIGSRFLHPGPGFGGSCFPKDTLALKFIAEDAGAPSQLVEATVAVNDARKIRMAERVVEACDGSVLGKKIAILGLTFKPKTDDMRESASIPILQHLVANGAIIQAYDPEGMDQAKPLLPASVIYCMDAFDAARDADALVVITEWNEFRALTPERLRELMAGNTIVDLRNIYDPAAMRRVGMRYSSIGRPELT